MAVKQPVFIDLFAGCGGLSLGLVKSGWKGLFAIERSPDAFETFRANFLDPEKPLQKFAWPDWLEDKETDISNLINNYRKELKSLNGKVDLIAGGPPCQGFSFAGRRKKDDPRNLLVNKYLEIVDLIKPRFVLIENVKGIAVGHGRSRKGTGKKTCGESTADSILELLDDHGYKVFLEKLNALDFGVPQVRDRYFFIGIRKDLVDRCEDFDPFKVIDDERKCFLDEKGLGDAHLPVSVGDAISDLARKATVQINGDHRFKHIRYKPPVKMSRYQGHMREGLNGTAPCSLRLANHKIATLQKFQSIRDCCKPGKCLSGEDKLRLGIKKVSTRLLCRKQPSGTITTLPDDQLHYRYNRILTVREQARLQAFPDSFVFKGKYTTGGHSRRVECPRYTQIGNAVSPFVAEVIGRALSNIRKNLVHVKK